VTQASVLGLGLIGGSAALSLGARGWDRDPQARRDAAKRGIDVADTLEATVAEAEIVIIAVPTASAPALLAEAAAARPGAIFSDTASLKRGILRAAQALPAGLRFVGGHPMAGSRTPGLAGADAALFQGRPWILVPAAGGRESDLAAVRALVSSVGAVPIVLDAALHDAAMTRISHLPHAVSSALAAAVARSTAADLGRLAGPGLLDATRLADAPIALQLELALADPPALADALDDVVQEIGALAEALRREDAEAVNAFFERGRAARRRIAPS